MDTINNFPQQARKDDSNTIALTAKKSTANELTVKESDPLRDLPQQNRELPQADPNEPLDQDRSLMVNSSKSKSLKASETDGYTPIEKESTVKESTANELTVKESTAKGSTAKELTTENRAAGKNDESKTTKPVITLIHIGKKKEWKWEKNDLQRGYKDYSLSASEPSRIWIDLGKTTDRYNQLAKAMEKYHKYHIDHSRAYIFYVPEDDLDLAPKIIQSIWGSTEQRVRVINDSPWDIDTLLNYELQER